LCRQVARCIKLTATGKYHNENAPTYEVEITGTPNAVSTSENQALAWAHSLPTSF